MADLEGLREVKSKPPSPSPTPDQNYFMSVFIILSLFGYHGGCKRHMPLVKTDQMHMLTWVFAGRTSLIVGFVVRLLICEQQRPNSACVLWSLVRAPVVCLQYTDSWIHRMYKQTVKALVWRCKMILIWPFHIC